MSFAEFSARRLKKSLSERYGLFGEAGVQDDALRMKQLENDILSDEVALVIPQAA